MRIEDVLARLAAVRPNGERSWMARCPAHDDRNPSLSVSEGEGGRVLFNCFAGCAAESVAAVCAREVGETVSRWLYLCTRPSNIERARLADIDVPAPLLDAGRDSVVATVDGAHADHGEVRRCVALAVLYCESRRPPPFECGLREGRAEE
jgi:hypothetical protein